MAIDFASQVLLTMNGSEFLKVDSSGRTITALQPAFNVNSGSATTQGTLVIPGGTINYNIGNCYNGTNGRFTAPVAGIYHFRWHQLVAFATTGRFDCGFYKNGSLYTGSRHILEKNGANTWRTLRTEAHIQLAVNDYVEVYYLIGGAALHNDSLFGSFSGYLIG